jgi:hypothetical protein
MESEPPVETLIPFPSPPCPPDPALSLLLIGLLGVPTVELLLL